MLNDDQILEHIAITGRRIGGLLIRISKPKLLNTDQQEWECNKLEFFKNEHRT